MKSYAKEQKIGNGKIIVIDFRKLHTEDFTKGYGEMSRRQLESNLFLVSPDGRIYINSKMPGAQLAVDAFKILVNESKEWLLGYEAGLKAKYPEIKDFDDCIAMKGTPKERGEAFYMLMIPVEIDRREVEKTYY